jgi:hypothetical protein
LDAVLGNGPDFTAIAKPHLQVTYQNPTSRKLAGLTFQERVRITNLVDCLAKEERASGDQRDPPRVACGRSVHR